MAWRSIYVQERSRHLAESGGVVLPQEPRDESREHTLSLVRQRRGEKTRKGTGVGCGETEKSRDRNRRERERER